MKFAVFPALCLHLALVSATDHNLQPCMPAAYQGAHNTFINRHVHAGTPEGTDNDAWEAFLKNNSFCNRPVQSFFPYGDMQRINDVCSPAGGKIYRRNLCISKASFSFVTLTVNNETCQVEHIMHESKHIILACAEIEKMCQPVHFQKNPEDVFPKDNAPDCPGAPSASHPGIRAPKTAALFVIFLWSALL